MRSFLIILFCAFSFSVNSQTVQPKCDSLQRVLNTYKFKIERIKYYIKVCQRNPKNNKYLKGWIIRAIK